MPKSLFVDPSAVRKSGKIDIASIPVNQYKSDFKAELARFGADGLVAIWSDMVRVREFETMLNEIKTKGAWNGDRVQPPRPGPPFGRPGGRVRRPVREPRP